jgi:competence protein ComEA
VIQAPPLPEPTATAGPIRVFVNGQVIQPDVYALPPGSIAQEAITAAGGFRPEADTAVVNLAQPLQDGMQIYVPAEGEVIAVEVATPVAGKVVAGVTAVNSNGLININTAMEAELDLLPGIGPSTAQKIIEHRETNGPFATIEAIMDVAGIGEAKFEAIQALITVDN